MNIITFIGIAVAIQLAQSVPVPLNYKEKYPELYSGYFEGDIVLSPGQRNGVPWKKWLWNDAVIPFEINGNFTQEQKNVLYSAMQEIFDKTCVVFAVKMPEDKYFVSIDNKRAGCNSAVGKVIFGGHNEINLEDSCFRSKGTIIHEMMHTIGFYHEHSRPDRDEYVDIYLENVMEGYEFAFDRQDDTSTYNVSYDYGSILHYPKMAWANWNFKPTIVPKDPTAEIGQREKLSDKDAQKINNMYNCKPHKPQH